MERFEGDWVIASEFKGSGENVERLAHEILKDTLDTDAPIGEVFKCSVAQETEMAKDQNFKAGQWIQGTNALIGLYSRLEEISKRFRKVEPITISVIDRSLKPSPTKSV